MSIAVPPVMWQFLLVGVQALFTRAELLIERGSTEEEIRAHIAKMEAENDTLNAERKQLLADSQTDPA
jgi:hypothetical protein